MTTIDTNILVRLLIRDHPEQTARVARLLSTGMVFVPLTVALELEWVLRSVYQMTPDAVNTALVTLLGTQNLRFEQADRLRRALTLADGGVEFVDALHLAAADPDEPFYTFDKALIRRGAQAGMAVVSP